MPEQDPQPGQAQSSKAFRYFSFIWRDFHLSHTFEDADEINRLALQDPSHHGAAADEDGRDVQAKRRHQHPGNDLVAVGDHDQGIKGMGYSHDLNGIGDQLAAGKGVFHACMSHGNPVANADDGEFDGRSACHADACLYVFGYKIQMNMPGYDFIGGIHNAYQGLCNFFIRIPHGFEKRSVGRPFKPLFHQVASHAFLLILFCNERNVQSRIAITAHVVIPYFFLRSGLNERTTAPASHISLFFMASSSFCSFSL